MTLADRPLSAVADSTTDPANWALAVVGRTLADHNGVRLRTTDPFALASVTSAGLRRLNFDQTRRAVALAFEQLFAVTRDAGFAHPLRVWSFIPGIHDLPAHPTASPTPDAEVPDRYMAFNAGRFDAMAAFYGSVADLARRVPAASGVGTPPHCDDLVIHLLSHRHPGTQVNNPAQVPAYRYSARYGQLPPCFARATRAPDGSLLISGTAAITGEDSRHQGSLDAQWQLTLANLRRVISADAALPPDTDPLSRLTSVRAYVPQAAHLASVREAAHRSFAGATEVEVVRADLCRRELLVEVEAVASPRP